MDISGGFDNLNWLKLTEDLETIGASVQTIATIRDYLTNRRASLTVGNSTVSKQLTRGCPQGSQLGPILWNASMVIALGVYMERTTKIIAYADDILVLSAAARKETVQSRAALLLDRLIVWAEERGLTFSATKTVAISLKGGIKLGQTIRFGNTLVKTTSPVRYLGVLIDYKRNFWNHVQYVAGKTEDMYSRLRAATSADWGAGFKASTVIYKAVFLPAISYVAQIWANGTNTVKAIEHLGSRQRRALLSVIRAYRTTSTDALCVIAGLFPLDLAIRQETSKLDFRQGHITKEEHEHKIQNSLQEWQNRWDNSTKGRWTYKWIPSIRDRLNYPMELDYYTTQYLGGHGDFNGKLYELKLKASPRCTCKHPNETVEHILLECAQHADERQEMLDKLQIQGGLNTNNLCEILKTRNRYEALSAFANTVLTKKREQGVPNLLENYLHYAPPR